MNALTTFQTADRLVAGVGAIASVAQIAAEIGGVRNALVISSSSAVRLGYTEDIRASLHSGGISSQLLSRVPQEPTEEQLLDLAAAVAGEAFDLYIGIGGGSVLDAAKLLSLMKRNALTPRELLEAARISSPGVPLILIPTTSGTGSEVTPNAIITFPDERIKTAVISPYLYPAAAVLDPELTLDLPRAITAATGMDAFTHALESFLSLKANPVSDMYSLQAVRLIAGSLSESYANGCSLKAREDMLYGSAFAGMALSCSGTAAVHALAYPLGGSFGIPHGVANAMLLPHVTAYNSEMCGPRLGMIAQAMGIADHSGDRQAGTKVVDAIEAWVKELGIPQDLRRYGIDESHLAQLSVDAAQVKRLLNNNPRPVSVEDITDLYRKLLPDHAEIRGKGRE